MVTPKFLPFLHIFSCSLCRFFFTLYLFGVDSSVSRYVISSCISCFYFGRSFVHSVVFILPSIIHICLISIVSG